MSLPMARIHDEYRTILGGAGWIEPTDRGRLRLEGRDVAPFLQALLTNDVSSLNPGEGTYAAYLTPQGRMLADLELYRRADAWLMSLGGRRVASIAERLDQSIFSEDVRITDASASLGELLIAGGQAPERLAVALGVSSEELRALSELQQIDCAAGFIARSGEARLPSFKIFVPAERREAAVLRLEAAGVPAMSSDLAEALRIEAGRPRFGADMAEDTIPLEAGLLQRAISTTKGCYVGQEIIVRVLHRGGGRVARRLVTLSLPTPLDGPPPPGTPLTAGDREVGRLTSVAWSPDSSAIIALGYLQRDLAETGRRVAVGRQAGVEAEVTGLAR
jgi:folate-binding protein YgfZ